MMRLDSNGKWEIKDGYEILIEPSENFINDLNVLIPPQDPAINTELADAYEAIAALFEMNTQLLQRLEVLEDGI